MRMVWPGQATQARYRKATKMEGTEVRKRKEKRERLGKAVSTLARGSIKEQTAVVASHGRFLGTIKRPWIAEDPYRTKVGSMSLPQANFKDAPRMERPAPLIAFFKGAVS